MSDEFKPAEEMSEKMKIDQYEQEQEFAPMPNVEPVSNASSWEDKSKCQPQMSFGAYCRPYLFSCKDVFGQEESQEKKDRVAMVDDDVEKSVNMCNTEELQRWLSE
jgi:hypothetical protein